MGLNPVAMKTDESFPARLTGLSESEAQARLAADGPNELPQPDRRTPLRIVLEVLREPMFALLIGGGAVYLLLGDIKEALILLAFALMSIVITVVQETRTEHVLEALRNLASPRALVIRDGVRKRISGREVVRGDVMLLAEGDRVPADALLLEAFDFQADESLLTGESVPVRKLVSPNVARVMAAPGGEDLPCVYSGSLGGSRQRHRRGRRYGRQQSDGQDRSVASSPGARAAPTADPDPQSGTAGGDRRWCRQRGRHGALRLIPRRMAGSTAGRNYHRHVDAAGGISGGAHSLHGDGRLAHLAGAGVDPAFYRHRSPWIGDCAVHGQDRHADRKSDVRCRTENAGREMAPRRRWSGWAELSRGRGLWRSGERAGGVRSDGKGAPRARGQSIRTGRSLAKRRRKTDKDLWPKAGASCGHTSLGAERRRLTDRGREGGSRGHWSAMPALEERNR